ncbi:MAG TPA: chromosome segregation protein SMC [Armatimonadota bacterium]
MRLQKLQLRGFKTFADRTEMDFGPGITAIVGPNGAGKSNITDAILWVLGEQSQRAVRSQKWEDVIFSGSDQRAPLGMAEVALTIDNSDGALPIDFSEVVIARRLFRSGQSEYLLNGTVVRLRDIADLLVDTGLTPDGYSVIGQGEIDAILSAHPEDRRMMIEQVAGVRKYQIRRAETERRLEKTQANLARVRDIIYELKRQREPLEKQAVVAREYRDLAESLKRLELALIVLDWDRRQEKRGQALHEMDNLRQGVERAKTGLKEIEIERDRLDEQAQALSERLEQTREGLSQAERKLDRSRQELTVVRQQQESLHSRQERLQPALAGLEQRRQELAAQEQRLGEEAQELRQRAESLTPDLAERRAALDTEQKRQAELQRQAGELSGQESRLQRELALAQREFEAMEGLQTDLESRIERLTSQQATTGQRRQELQERVNVLREQVREAQGQAAERRGRWQEAQKVQAALRHTLREHRQKKGLLSDYVAALESRGQVLRELEEAQEGFAEGPRMVTKAAREGHLTGVLGLLGEMLEVPRKLEPAVEAGLGQRLQWVLVQDQEAAQAAAAYLAEHNLGRATFLPVDRVASASRSMEAATVGRGPGVEGGLAGLIRFPKKLAHVFEVLLSDVLVVHSLDDAWPLRTRLRGPARIVTLAGEVVGPFGDLTAGGGDVGVQAAFSRKRELREVEESLIRMRVSLAQMWGTEEDLEAQQTDSASAVEGLEAEASGLEKQAEAGEGQMRGLADSLRAAGVALEETEREVEALRERRQQAAEQAAQAQLSASGLAHTLEGLSAERVVLEGHRTQGESLTQMRLEVGAAEVALAEARERVRSVENLLAQARGELRRVAEDQEKRTAELHEIEQQLQSLPGQTEAGRQAAAELEKQVETLKAAATEQSQQLAEFRRALADLERSRRELETLGEQQREELYRAELTLARAEASLENLENQLREVYSLGLDEARRMQPEGFNEPAARREANVLRTEIRKLGPVNLSSIEEVERLGAREQYLQNQADDLDQAKADLLEVIAEVDAAATTAFLSAFSEVGAAFQELFERFFPTGETSLELTNPEAPLTSGVEVLVRLPGKRRQNLLLLSGGERAMTAMALLFAMIKVRPAPFCVMDEIDAAIDANNTDKLADIILEFAARSQFILITHNPRSMEAASVLYGVTMRQGGVSRLISVTLEDAKKEAKEQVGAERQAGMAAGGAGSRVLPLMS